jgi:hypothetical protein
MQYFLEHHLKQTASEKAGILVEVSALGYLDRLAAGLDEKAAKQEPEDGLTLEAGTWLEGEAGSAAGSRLHAPPHLFDIFLSYSSKDAVAVVGLYHWLVPRYRVYLDRFDRLLNPAVVTRATATIVRRRIVQSRSLFVATSQHALASDWVPWEMGFADGLMNKAAVLFIAPRANVPFNRQSYFELYPEVGPGPTGAAKGHDLILTDPQAVPPWSVDWDAWLRMPRRY